MFEENKRKAIEIFEEMVRLEPDARIGRFELSHETFGNRVAVFINGKFLNFVPTNNNFRIGQEQKLQPKDKKVLKAIAVFECLAESTPSIKEGRYNFTNDAFGVHIASFVDGKFDRFYTIEALNAVEIFEGRAQFKPSMKEGMYHFTEHEFHGKIAGFVDGKFVGFYDTRDLGAFEGDWKV